MADLKPLGSEKLEGQEQINRILEISNYGSKPTTLSESKSSKADYSIQMADGKYYGIVKEKTGYVVKVGISESELDYNEPMQNRKHYKSFSQAMKKVNLIAGELNRLHENVEGVNIIGEQKKFVLKTPAPKVDVDINVDKPSLEPEEDLDLDLDMDMDMDMDIDSEESVEDDDLDMDMDIDSEEEDVDVDVEVEDEEGSFKTIQKITGKLGQKLRTYDKNQGLSSEDIKYVLNSIISAVELERLSEEDKEDILANFEEEETDYDMEGEVDIDVESGDDELDLDMDLDMDLDSDESIEDEELSEEDGMSTMVDEIFGESKVDKVLEKYFVVTEGEKKVTESKKIKKFLSEKINNISIKKEIKRLSESVEQELTSEFIMKENTNIKFLGKTNKGNLVFESDKKQLKVTSKGELL
tara:strand:+ start:17 stop:1252 length:1236 start_codon:yes stop_codon:yes gene_type:complete